MAKTILIADDNDDLRAMLGYQLQVRGYQVITAVDGEQAVKKTKQSKPDLVLLDIMMPVMDGTEAGSQLKADPSTRNIPVIYLTSLIEGTEASKSKDGEIVMPKSTEIGPLLDKIREVLATAPPPKTEEGLL